MNSVKGCVKTAVVRDATFVDEIYFFDRPATLNFTHVKVTTYVANNTLVIC